MYRFVILFAGALIIQAAGLDLDSGHNAPGLARALEGKAPIFYGEELIGGGWVRLRGIAAPEATSGKEQKAKSEEAIDETRRALATIREQGLKTCVLLRWPADWKKVYLPQDLSAAYENGRRLGAAYDDLVDAWEVDNEPDLGFVPESAERYTAFLKATYLGLKAGMAEGRRRTAEGGGQGADFGHQISDVREQRTPLVLMGSLGLPPGPWLERFAANDGFAYTDGFNYHYYGYADDFTGVYQQFEAAVAQLSDGSYSLTGALPNNQQPITNNFSQKKSLPVFLTEIGYGMLGKVARNSKEGRLRQWRWFKSVGEQANQLRIEAPMAFYLPPYLEFDMSEYGLTVPAGAVSEKASSPAGPTADRESGRRLGEDGEAKLKAEGSEPSWVAGGISYSAGDFQVSGFRSQVSPEEPWMTGIGKQIGGNEATPALAQWMALRAGSMERGAGSKSWTVTTPLPSPVVIDFLNGEGLSFVKRFNGSFVSAREPITPKKPDGASEAEMAKQTGDSKSGGQKPTTPSQQPTTPPRSEEFILQVRTANGNLFEVYPTRMAKPEWQSFLEPGGNFTMSFYGRAELPWRFKESKPASLVVVMYPRSLPATYEFRRAQLVGLRAKGEGQSASMPKADEFRYGSGKVVLYNFSDKAVSGRLVLPAGVGRVVPNAPGSDGDGGLGTGRHTSDEFVPLTPGERREIDVYIQVPLTRFERIEAPIVFVPEDQSISPARFVTSFTADIAGMKATEVAALLQPKAESGKLKAEAQASNTVQPNRELIVGRARATEEAPMTLAADSSKLVAFAQQGARVERTDEGFVITVTEIPAGKPQRVEVEIPWPDGLGFGEDEFLSVEFRLRP